MNDISHITESASLPKKIWMLWLQGWDVAPEIVQECKKSWEVLNPEWEVLLLDEENLGAYIDLNPYGTVSRIPRQAFSDIVRIELLAKYGGVWVDATLYCSQPLDEWLPERMSQGFFTFEKPRFDKLVTSWFLASSKESYITRAWVAAVRSYWSRGPVAPKRFITIQLRVYWILIKLGFVEWLKRSMFFTKQYLGFYPYFWFHYLFEVVYKKDITFKNLWDAVPKYSALGPRLVLAELLKRPWYEKIALEIDSATVPVHKLTWRMNKERMDASGVDTLITKTKQKYNFR